jgi:hypothetical protein
MPAAKVLNCQQKAQKTISAQDFFVADLDLVPGETKALAKQLKATDKRVNHSQQKL